ncbi:MAG: hypothetical protein ACLQVM_08250, partial [Terriglobia bacterium]
LEATRPIAPEENLGSNCRRGRRQDRLRPKGAWHGGRPGTADAFDDRIIYAIFNGLNENPEWKNRTLRLFTQAA